MGNEAIGWDGNMYFNRWTLSRSLVLAGGVMLAGGAFLLFVRFLMFVAEYAAGAMIIIGLVCLLVGHVLDRKRKGQW